MAVTISSFRAAGYKAFSGEAPALALAPITLVIGHNNAGKSSLVRAPVLLADSLGDEDQILALDTRGLDFGRDPATVFHEVAHGSLSLEIGLSMDGLADPERAEISLRAECGLVSSPTSRRKLVVRDFEVCEVPDRAGTFVSGLPMRVSLADARTSRYQVTLGPDARLVSDVEWDRLLPMPSRLVSELGKMNDGSRTIGVLLNLRELGRSVHYLGPFRALARRQYDFASARPSVGPDGAGAVELLAWDRQQGGDLLARVSRWFAEQPQFGFELQLAGSERAEIGSLLLTYPSGREVNIADAGAGISQVVPLVVRCLATGSPEDTTALQIVEQPELHLHPAACACLADLFIQQTVASGPKLLVETHSENLLLRMRRRIAEGRIAPDQVAIYWVENETGTDASFRRLPIGPDGWVEDWPDGVFAEDAEEARALARAMSRS